MRPYYRYYILCFTLFCGIDMVFGQPFPELHFQKLTDKDGLSNNFATYITQDNKGFIWVATNNGLNRFDGYRFKRFFHSDVDSTSLPGNNIGQLTVDEKNNLWVSTHTGLALFNTITQRCLPLISSSAGNPIVETAELPLVYIDAGRKVWATTDDGLVCFDSSLHYNNVYPGSNVPGFQFYDRYFSHYSNLQRDKRRQLWAARGNRLYLLDTITKKAIRTFIGSQGMSITSIFFDNENRCWLSTWGGGIYEFMQAKGEFRHVSLGDFSGFNSPVAEWTINNKRFIVIGSDRNAFLLLDPKTMLFKIYAKNGYKNSGVSARSINYFFVDRQNLLWCATENGLWYIAPSSTFYDIVQIRPFPEKKNPLLPSKTVITFLQDTTGNWVGTWFGGGLYRYDQHWHLKKHFLGLPVPEISDITKTAFSLYRQGREIYCATDSCLFAIDTGNYHMRSFFPPGGKTPVNFRSIIPIDKGLWWVRTHHSGIYVFDVSKGKFIRHYEHTEGCSKCLPAGHLSQCSRAQSGDIYIASDDGLYEYRKETDDFISYRRNVKDPVTFPTNSIDGFAFDKYGKLWIGTDNGICVFNPATKKVEKVFPENETMGDVYDVCVDDYQNVWFDSYAGNWCWLRDKGRLIHLTGDEDFPKSDGNGIFVAGNDGCVYNGCLDAIVRYYPGKLMEVVKPVIIPIAISELVSEDRLIPYEINEKCEKMVTLAPSQSSFSVDFAVLNYDRVTSNQYYYRLLPAVKGWRQSDNGHLTFYDLSPGSYRLEVKGGNDWTGEFSGADSLSITIRPKWWQASWFKLLCLVLAVAVIFVLVRRRIANIRKEAALLQQQASFRQKIAETEMQALRAQMNPHFIFNSLNSIENFMMRNDKRRASDYFSKFALLIRMILDSSRNEWVPFVKDMEALRLYVELEQLRFDGTFSYQAIIDPILLDENFSVPPLLIQPFVENAIIHGFSQSEKQGLQLLVSVKSDNGYISYAVHDNGIGRKQAAVYKQSNYGHKSMGLNIAQQRINLMNQQQQAKGEVTISDLYDEYGDATGTKVEIKISLFRSTMV